MFQTDTVYLQTLTEVNTYGSISQAWTNSTAVTCDVQDVNREYVYKNFGLTDATEYKQVFDHTNASWVKGNQVSYLSEQYIVRLVNKNMEKMGKSNHTFVILSRVV